MAIFEQMKRAMDEKDADAMIALLADDFTFVRHGSGETLDRDGMIELLKGMMASGAWGVSNHRCLYENDDIMVEHSVMSFPDGTKEAVMAVNMLKDGKVTRLETGATPLGT